MNNKCLLGFGDSWAVGAGLNLQAGEKTYIKLAATQLGIGVYNYAQCSTGIPHLILQLKKFITSSCYNNNIQYHAIFFLSAIERDLYFDDLGNPQEMIPRNIKFVEYYSRVYSDNLAIFKLNTNLLALRQLCNYYNINDRYIFGWQTPELWPEIDRARFWNRGEQSVLDLFLEDYPDAPRNIIHLKENMNHPWIIKPQFAGDSSGGHPNQLGHEKIAQALIKWINPCL
jgi:hypothetical protein